MQFTVTIAGPEGRTSATRTAQELEATETISSLLAQAQHGSISIERV